MPSGERGGGEAEGESERRGMDCIIGVSSPITVLRLWMFFVQVSVPENKST